MGSVSTLRSVTTALFLLFGSLPALAQSLPFEVGVTGGIPMTETIRGYQNGGRFGGYQAESATRRYVAGGTAGARLSSRFSVSAGLLYRRFGYDYDAWNGLPVPLVYTHYRGTGASWEVPALMRWKVVQRRSMAPFAALGASYRRLAGMKETPTIYDNFFPNNPRVIPQPASGTPRLLENRNAIAPLVAGGVEFRQGWLIITPEIRYTRWCSDTLGGFLQPLRWNRRQLDFLLGIGIPFGRH